MCINWYLSGVKRSSSDAPYISRKTRSASAAWRGIQLRMMVFMG